MAFPWGTGVGRRIAVPGLGRGRERKRQPHEEAHPQLLLPIDEQEKQCVGVIEDVGRRWNTTFPSLQ